MADTLALARSFYAWMAKIALQESKEYFETITPDAYSTDPEALKVITRIVAENMEGTPYHKRALYWENLYKEFEHTAVIPLDEAAFRSFLQVMRNAFLPPPAPEKPPKDSFLVSLIRKALQKLYNVGVQIEGHRRERWTYKKMRDMYREEELTVMASTIDSAPYDDEEEDIRKSFAYKWRVWRFALNIFSGPKYLRILATAGATPIEYMIAILVYFTRKAFGEKVAEDVFPKRETA